MQYAKRLYMYRNRDGGINLCMFILVLVLESKHSYKIPERQCEDLSFRATAQESLMVVRFRNGSMPSVSDCMCQQSVAIDIP